jgi:hypothetical protein
MSVPERLTPATRREPLARLDPWWRLRRRFRRRPDLRWRALVALAPSATINYRVGPSDSSAPGLMREAAEGAPEISVCRT